MQRVQDVPVNVTTKGELERLYREQGDRIWGAILAYAGDPELANDAVAEAFAQALRRGEAIAIRRSRPCRVAPNIRKDIPKKEDSWRS